MVALVIIVKVAFTPTQKLRRLIPGDSEVLFQIPNPGVIRQPIGVKIPEGVLG
jgi:hypothetical protein